MKLAASSAAASIVDLATLLALLGLHVAVGAATIAGCLAGGAVNFALTCRFVFARRGTPRWRELAAYALAVVAGGALLAGAIVEAATRAGVPALAAKAVAAALVLGAWSYPISRSFVFEQKGAPR